MSLERAAVRRRKQRWRRRWYGACVLLCAVAVFVTTYALILPAVTEETGVYCGIEEHRHEDACYCTEYLCGYNEMEDAHLHSDECVVQEQILICTEAEEEGHFHNESCFAQEMVLSCDLEEGEEHTHGECCYEASSELLCVIPESVGHIHENSCYESQTTYVCGLAEVHIHQDTCYHEGQVFCCVLMENEGHVHEDSCYETVRELICGLEAAHVHEEACAQQVMCCTLAEHTHTLSCYADPSADLEVQEIWERTLPSLTGDKAADIMAIAHSQLGYRESEKNYIVSESGISKGYSRYGQWYGDVYGDWCAMFASFCLRYAGYDEVPIHSNCQRWVEKLTETQLYMPAGVYIPQGGDIIFFDLDGDDTADHVGLVAEVDDSILTIEGNTGNAVKTRRYSREDGTVMGYGVLSHLEAAPPKRGLEGNYQEVGDAAKFGNLVADSTTTHIRLMADMPISTSYTLTANKNLTIDLNGHTLNYTNTSNPMFIVQSGRTLTIWDSQQPMETVTVADVENDYGNIATLSGKNLTYYVTVTQVVDPALGATQEEVQQHVITAAGGIKATSQPIVSLKGGVFNLEGGMLYGDGNPTTNEKRAIYMESGTANLNHGYICGFGLKYTGTMDVSNQFGGAIRMTGGTMNIVGSVIAANTASSAGAIFSSGGTINIGGNGERVGIIAGNQALSERDAGSGVNRYNGGGGIYAYNTTINMTAGYLTNNFIVQYTGPYCDENGGEWSGGGGIMMEGTSEMDFCGGYITGNFCDGGGGIRTTLKGKSYLRMYHLIDEDGTVLSSPFVTANATRAAEGAGISLGSAADNSTSGASITGGYITNNRVLKTNHWGGGGIFCGEGAVLHVENALVVNNSAGGFGGGMAGCSTGHMFLYAHDGCAIYDNRDMVDESSPNYTGSSSNKKADILYCPDSRFLDRGHSDYYCALESVVVGGMLGGGSANWEGSADYVPVENAGKDDVIAAGKIMGLESHASEEDKLAAQLVAKLYINGNYSYTHGGGILCNGVMSVGTVEPMEIPVSFEPDASKKLVDSEGNELPMDDCEFHFVITDHLGNELSRGVTDSTGQIIFDRLLVMRSAGTFTFYIKELQQTESPNIRTDTTLYRLTTTVKQGDSYTTDDPATKADIVRRYLVLSGYVLDKRNTQGEWETVQTKTYSGTITGISNGEDNTTVVTNTDKNAGTITLSVLNGTPAFTNVYVEYTDIQVRKVWKDNNTQAVTVRLYRDDGLLDTQTLNSENNWSYTWSDMPVGDGTKKYDYRVEEDTVAGYVAEYYSEYSTVGGTYWIPTQALSLGGEYIITNSGGNYAMMLTRANANNTLTTSDRVAVTRKSGTLTVDGATYSAWYEGDMESDRVFVAEATGDGAYLTLKNKAIDSWLATTSTSSGWWNKTYNLQGRTTKSNGSAFSLNNGALQGTNGNSYTGSDRYTVIYSSNKFGAANSTSNAASVYKKVELAKGLSFTIVNTPVEGIKYTINLEKVSGKDGSALVGVKFRLLGSDGAALSFATSGDGVYTLSTANGAVTELITSTGGRMVITGLPAGQYILRETEAPPGHLPIEDYRLTLGEGSAGTTISLRLVDPIFAYTLPETGGNGTTSYIVVGLVLLLTGGILFYGKRRREAVEDF